MSKIAIFPGSFDPFHEGHLFVVNQALKKFDFIYLIVSWNEKKIKRKNTFEKTKEKIENIFINNNKIKVLINKDKLTTQICCELDCFNIIRGIRNTKDQTYEAKLKESYVKLDNRVKMFYFFSDEKHKNISSSKIQK